MHGDWNMAHDTDPLWRNCLHLFKLNPMESLFAFALGVCFNFVFNFHVYDNVPGNWKWASESVIIPAAESTRGFWPK